jgi:hypothetical protein
MLLRNALSCRDPRGGSAKDLLDTPSRDLEGQRYASAQSRWALITVEPPLRLLRRRIMDAVRHVVAAMPLVVVLALAGCGDDVAPVAPPQSRLVDEMAAHHGQVCPDQLPRGEDPDGYGFGTGEPADERPSLLTPDAAWVCRYDPRAGPGPNGDGSTIRWQRGSKPQPVDSTRLAALTEHLDELKPATASRVCTNDLGPRWMLAFTHKGDLTGVVIDDYGCHDIRLTDEPFETAPGDPGQEGAVPGTLSAPPQLLADLKAGQRRLAEIPQPQR